MTIPLCLGSAFLACHATSVAGAVRLPAIDSVHFEENVGQAPAAYRFLARGRGFEALFSSSGVEFHLGGRQNSHVMRMLWAQPNRGVLIRPEAELPGISSYFRGTDSSRWKTGVRHYGGIRYTNLYPGIDLVFYRSQEQLEFDFVVRPGSDPSLAKLQFEGAALKLDGDDLVISTPAGEIRQKTPVVYQDGDNGRTQISARYELGAQQQVYIRVGEYDRGRTLIVDPSLVFSTLIPAQVEAVAVGAGGDIHITGSVSQSHPPGLRFPSGATAGVDAFVMKLSPDGGTLLYAVYLGGTYETQAHAIAVDSAGSAYITGHTRTTGFPVVGGFQAQIGGAQTEPGREDAFVAKLNPSGTALVYSSFLGGSATDYGYGIAVDSSGQAHISGTSTSSDFPAVQSLKPFATDTFSIFVTKVNAAGSALIYSSCLGTGGGNAIAVDASGNAYVAGISGVTAPLLTATSNAYQAAGKGGNDAFVVKLNPAGTAQLFSTYLGGTENDWADSIAVDGAGAIYLGGRTASSNFPVVSPICPDYGESFVSKLNPQSGALIFSTRICGAVSGRVALDTDGNIYVAGLGLYSFQGVDSLYPARGGDAFLMSFSPSFGVRYATLLGGTATEGATAVAVAPSGDVILAGTTASTDFPLYKPLFTAGSFHTSFVARINACSFTFSETQKTFPIAGGSGSFSITTTQACAWTASSGASWVTVTPTTSTTGSGTVNYSVSAFAGYASRTATIEAAGQIFTITQAGIPCSYTLSSPSLAAAHSGGPASVGVIAGSGCTWTAASDKSWVTINAGSSGNGNGTVAFTVAPNNGTARSTTLTIAGNTFTINQAAAPFSQQPQHADPVGYEAGRFPSRVHLRDYNGDGRLDAAVLTADNVLLFRGKSDGTFQPPLTIVFPVYIDTLETGDLNNDGRLDLFGSGRYLEGGYRYVLVSRLGNGDGTFQAAGVTFIGEYATLVTSGDVNGDGRTDAIVTWNGTIQSYLSGGNGLFFAPVASPTPSTNLTSVTLADFNGDGKLDVLFGGGALLVRFGDGSGSFSGGVGFNAPLTGRALAADVNGDSKPDVLAIDGDKVRVFLNTGSGNFGAAALFGASVPPYTYPTLIGVADLDGDGKVDIAISHLSQGFTFIAGKGDGTFQAPVLSPAVSALADFAIGDLNGDGMRDLVCLNGSLTGVMSVLINTTVRSTPVSATFNSNPSNRTITVDGTPYNTPQSFNWLPGSQHTAQWSTPQQVVTGTRAVFTQWNDGSTSNPRSIGITAAVTYSGVFKLQHQLIVLNSGRGNTINITAQTGSSTFGEQGYFDAGALVRIEATPTMGYRFAGFVGDATSATSPLLVTMDGPRNITALFVPTNPLPRKYPRDFRGIGRSDVLLYNPATGDGYSGYSDGAGGFSYLYQAYLQGFTHLRSGFFYTNDSRAAMAIYNRNNGYGYIGRSDGAGRFLYGSLFWSPGYDNVETGDLNGDGLTDVVLHMTDGTMYTGISNGDGTFQYFYRLVSPGYTNMLVSDFTGDGLADVFLYRRADGLAFLGASNGGGNFNFQFVQIDSTFDHLQVGDFNSDGKSDLLFYYSGNGVAKMGVATGTNFTFSVNSWTPGFSAVRVFDYNGDGSSDIALYDITTANGYLGIGNGAGGFSFTGLYFGPGMDRIIMQDLNGDGRSDVMLYKSNDGAVYTGLSTGNPANPFVYKANLWGPGKLLAQ